MDLPDSMPRSAIAQEIAKRFVFLRRMVAGEINRALHPLGATSAQYQVLLRLAVDGAVSQQELTLDAGLDAAGVSRLVAKMAEQKLVGIRVDSRDRRRRLVRLLPAGFAMVESLSPIVDAAARRVVGGLSETEEVKLLQLLDKAVSSSRQHAERRGRRRGAEGAGSEGPGADELGSDGAGADAGPGDDADLGL
jgi:DNA-binding MarR family transcriptional regulator